MVDKLREHLNRHLSRLGKKKIDLLVVNYAAKLVCVCTLATLCQRSLAAHMLVIGSCGINFLLRHKTKLHLKQNAPLFFVKYFKSATRSTD